MSIKLCVISFRCRSWVEPLYCEVPWVTKTFPLPLVSVYSYSIPFLLLIAIMVISSNNSLTWKFLLFIKISSSKICQNESSVSKLRKWYWSLWHSVFHLVISTEEQHYSTNFHIAPVPWTSNWNKPYMFYYWSSVERPSFENKTIRTK